MVRTRRQTAAGRGALIHSAIEHPVVWDFVGKGRYLQAAVSKFYVELYKSRFDSITSKNLSNIAAENGVLSLLSWTRSIGCSWGDSVFLSAVKGGRTETLEYLIFNDCPIPQGEDACTCAAKEGRLEVLMWLREREAAWGEAVCTQAAAGGFLLVLEWALDNGCSWNREEALEKAAGAGHLHILEWAKNLHGDEMLTRSLCRSAAKGGHLGVLQRLRSWNCPWERGCIWFAVSDGRADVFHWAKTHGCPYDVNEEVGDLVTLLILAIEAGHVDIVKTLIADGANVHHTPNESTCLHLAVALERGDIVRELISARVDVNARGRSGSTPLFVAVACGNVELTKVLCDAGADVELGGDGLSPLMMAVDRNHVDLITILLERGAKPNRICKRFVALHLACQKDFPEAALCLIRGGADVNMLLENRASPLHYACMGGCLKSVSILLKNGADLDVRRADGQTPLVTAIVEGHVGVVEALIAGGCNLSLDLHGHTPLGLAIFTKCSDIVTMLINAGADVNEATSGSKPLDLADVAGLVEISACLRAAGATSSLDV